MYPWQIIYFVAVVALAAFVLLRSPQGTVGKIMTFMLNWLAPYTSITIAFVAIFQQGFYLRCLSLLSQGSVLLLFSDGALTLRLNNSVICS
jgi:hypothetical protein